MLKEIQALRTQALEIDDRAAYLALDLAVSIYLRAPKLINADMKRVKKFLKTASGE